MTKPNEPEGPCALCGNPKHRHGSGYPATCPIIPTYRAPAQPVADAHAVTEADRELHMWLTGYPLDDGDSETVRRVVSHRLQSVAAATAAKDAAIRARDDHFRNAQRLAEKLAAKDAEISRLKGQFDRYFHEAADAQEEVERLREGIERALCCTPHIRSERSQFHGIGETHKIVYDCGNPWEILRAALSEAREAGALANDSAPS